MKKKRLKKNTERKQKHLELNKMLETDLDFHTHTTQAIYFKQPGWSYKKHVIT